MHTVDTFRTAFPEFASTDAGLVQAKLTEAALSIDPNVWRLKATVGQGYLAAHLITLSPKGQNARMVVTTKEGTQATTTYWGHFKRLQREVTRGMAVAGGMCFSPPFYPWRQG